jgi:hypothetical protein
VKNVQELEVEIGKEIWLVVPGGQLQIDFTIYNWFVEEKKHLPQPVVSPSGVRESRLAVLIHSGGGIGEAAYQLATLFRRRSHGFTAIVPRWAKSAATLLTLGAESIILGEDGELGPLDAQTLDYDDEEGRVSALDAVQAVEALEQSAIDTAMNMLEYLHERTRKRFNTLMPSALHFAAEITKPLFENIDPLRYSRQSRILQEAQDYAERLLQPAFKKNDASAIARDLVRNYPTHGFVIDREEAARIGKKENQPAVGLKIKKNLSPNTERLLDAIYHDLPGVTALGRIVPK